MFLSKKILISSYKDLGNITDRTGKKAIEVTSAIRYLVATSALLKKYDEESEIDLSVHNTRMRDEFIEEVGRVVRIVDSLYTSNFIQDFSKNSNFAVGNNFLTTRLKTSAKYPGRPAPLLEIVNEKISLYHDFIKNLNNSYHNFKNLIIPFDLWLLRLDDLNLDENVTNFVFALNSQLEKRYEKELYSYLKIEVNLFEKYIYESGFTLKELINDKPYDFNDFEDIFSENENTVPISIGIRYSGENRIYFGPPGTGKSYCIDAITESVSENYKERVTFHPEYDHYSFVGGYKPISEDGEVKYRFVPQVFTNIYVKAWKEMNSDFYLIIEEINRGNCAEIFGFLFQILDRRSNYSVTPQVEQKEYLESQLGEDSDGIFGGKMRMPPNLNIYATMNTSDQSLFPMDSAFKRRWSWVFVPICYDELNEDGSLNVSYEYIISLDETTYFRWIDFIKAVNIRIKNNPNLGSDKCIGNYFISTDSSTISLAEFINKVIFYLWIDVFKDEEDSIFTDYKTYEDFFPLSLNALPNTYHLLENLGVPRLTY